MNIQEALVKGAEADRAITCLRWGAEGNPHTSCTIFHGIDNGLYWAGGIEPTVSGRSKSRCDLCIADLLSTGWVVSEKYRYHGSPVEEKS